MNIFKTKDIENLILDIGGEKLLINKQMQQQIVHQSNRILEEITETTTKFEFNLGFTKVSRSIKKIKK